MKIVIVSEAPEWMIKCVACYQIFQASKECSQSGCNKEYIHSLISHQLCQCELYAHSRAAKFMLRLISPHSLFLFCPLFVFQNISNTVSPWSTWGRWGGVGEGGGVRSLNLLTDAPLSDFTAACPNLPICSFKLLLKILHPLNLDPSWPQSSTWVLVLHTHIATLPFRGNLHPSRFSPVRSLLSVQLTMSSANIVMHKVESNVICRLAYHYIEQEVGGAGPILDLNQPLKKQILVNK